MSDSEELNEYGLREYSFEIGPMDDTSETVAIVGSEYSSVSDSEKFYRKEDVDPLLENTITTWQQVQIYYNIDVLTGEHLDVIPVKEQRKILPEFLSWYSPTWFAKNFPHNEEDLPKGVKAHKHFVSFDPDKGLTLCVEYLIDENIVMDTDEFKKTLGELVDDAEGQFSDGWGESFEQHCFRIGEEVYYPRADSDIHGIVASVGFSESLMVKWKSIDEIEHVDWMLSYNNDAANMLFHEDQHKRVVERETKLATALRNTETLDMIKYVETQRDKFFVAR